MTDRRLPLDPVERMLQRIRVTKTESETALFFDLMYLGEMLLKLVVCALVAAIDEDESGHQYRIQYQLVRADGLGAWVTALDDVLDGPAGTRLSPSTTDDRRELMQKFHRTDSAWQRQAVDLMHTTLELTEEGARQASDRVALRALFQEFGQLRNRTRGHGAPTGRKLAQAVTTLEESLLLLASSLGLFSRREWAFLRTTIAGDIRCVPMGGDDTAFSPHLEVADPSSVREGIHVIFDVPRRIALVESDVDLSDYFFANGALRGNNFELLSYISDERRSGDGVPFLAPGVALPRSETSASAELEAFAGSLANIPPPLPDYVRRPGLEVQLTRELRDTDRHPVVTLVGRGGVGKTSLALHVLHELAADSHYLAIVWFSARDIDLHVKGPRSVAPDVLTLEEIARQFADLVGIGPTDNPVDLFANCMSGSSDLGPFVFVFDNFETVTNPLELYELIDAFVRLPNKVLITSRSREFRGDYPVEVGGMTREEFDELARSTVIRLGIERLVDPQYLSRLYNESGGHPYVVRVLLSEIALLGRQGSPERIMARQEDILDALFERTFAALSAECQRVFLTLCNWRSTVPRLALEAALLRPSNERLDVPRALETLERYSLIEIFGTEVGDEAEQVILVPLAAALFGRRKLQVSELRMAVEVDTELLRAFGAATAADVGRGFEYRLERMVKTVAVRMKEHPGSVAEELAILEYIARQYPRAWLRLSDLYREHPDPEEGLERSLSALYSYLEQNSQDIDVWRRVADICRAREDAPGEMNARLQVAEHPAATLEDISRATNVFNSLQARGSLGSDADEKRAAAHRLRQLFETRLERADATDLSRIAWLCIHLHDDEAAVTHAKRGLELDSNNRYCRGILERLEAKPHRR